MEDKDRPDGRKKGNNPTGKGGFREKPHLVKKGLVANQEKAEKTKEAKAKLYIEELQVYKDNLRNLALYDEDSSIKLRATHIILNIVVEGKLEPVKLEHVSSNDQMEHVERLYYEERKGKEEQVRARKNDQKVIEQLQMELKNMREKLGGQA